MFLGMCFFRFCFAFSRRQTHEQWQIEPSHNHEEKPKRKTKINTHTHLNKENTVNRLSQPVRKKFCFNMKVKSLQTIDTSAQPDLHAIIRLKVASLFILFGFFFASSSFRPAFGLLIRNFSFDAHTELHWLSQVKAAMSSKRGRDDKRIKLAGRQTEPEATSEYENVLYCKYIRAVLYSFCTALSTFLTKIHGFRCAQ